MSASRRWLASDRYVARCRTRDSVERMHARESKGLLKFHTGYRLYNGTSGLGIRSASQFNGWQRNHPKPAAAASINGNPDEPRTNSSLYTALSDAGTDRPVLQDDTAPRPPADGNLSTSPPGSAGSTATAVPVVGPSSYLNPLDYAILSIALPMLATLAADPVAGLVDAAYLGRAGSAQLAGVGVALSVFNTATKLLNVPLLAVTTGAVARATGEAARAAAAAAAAAAAEAAVRPPSTAVATLVAVAPVTPPTTSVAAPVAIADVECTAAAAAQSQVAGSCLLLATLVGVLQAAVLLVGGAGLVQAWGVGSGTAAYGPAVGFLLVRAAGAPVTILMLTMQGVFRGLQDTRTPMLVSLAANLLNVLLAPLLIFGANLGAVGAAAATVASQALLVAVMGCQLRERLPGLSGRGRGGGEQGLEEGLEEGAAAGGGGGEVGSAGGPWAAVGNMLALFKPTGYLILRSASVTASYAVATSLVARAGTAVTASHQICFQLWLACSLLADALAVAAQSLMARDLGAGRPGGAAAVAERVSGLSLVLGVGLAVGLAVVGRVVPELFSGDPEVLRLVAGLLPVLATSQPITVLAMAWDGILYGAGGFRYAALSMAAAALPAIVAMTLPYGGGGAAAADGLSAVGAGGLGDWLVQVFGGWGAGGAGGGGGAEGGGGPVLSGAAQLGRVWMGLGLMMALRWITIAVPYCLRIGPFRKLRGGGGDYGEAREGGQEQQREWEGQVVKGGEAV